MKTTRRRFLGGILTIGALAVLPVDAFSGTVPTIFADGIHDDAEGLQALLDGMPVNIEGQTIATNSDNHIQLSGGSFMLGSPLYVERTGLPISVTDNAFSRMQSLPVGTPMVMMEPGWSGEWKRNACEHVYSGAAHRSKLSA